MCALQMLDCYSAHTFVQLVRSSPIEKLQQSGNKEVHSMCILIHQEGQAAKEVHNPADGMQHGLPCAGGWRRRIGRVEGCTCTVTQLFE